MERDHQLRSEHEHGVSIRLRWRVFGKSWNESSKQIANLSFNPLALESVWKASAKIQGLLIAECFNPLALESVWKEEKEFFMVKKNRVSIRLRWRVFGKSQSQALGTGGARFQSACAGECLERALESSRARTFRRFNPLALESVWKDPQIMRKNST